MDIKKIEALAELMNKNMIGSLELTEGDTKISLKRGGGEALLPAASAAPCAELKVTCETNSAGQKAEEAKPQTINSPLAGVFYSAPSPESKPFVSAGSSVKKGDVICIVEAMKLMNEITAERDCEIAEVLAGNETLVEYGQPLFVIK